VLSSKSQDFIFEARKRRPLTFPEDPRGRTDSNLLKKASGFLALLMKPSSPFEDVLLPIGRYKRYEEIDLGMMIVACWSSTFATGCGVMVQCHTKSCSASIMAGTPEPLLDGVILVPKSITCKRRAVQKSQPQ
jgi:hypothetical protein